MSKFCCLAVMLLTLPAVAAGQTRCSDSRSEYSALEDICPYADGFAAFKIRGRWGFVDKSGRVAVEPKYDDVSRFAFGLAAVEEDEKWGFIDTTGKVRVPIQYGYVENFSEGLAVVEADDKYGYIDAEGRVVISPAFSRASRFIDGVAVVETVSGRYALIDKTGNIIKELERGVSVDEWKRPFGRFVANKKYPSFLIHVDGRRRTLPSEAGDYPTYSGGRLVVHRLVDSEPRYGVMDLDGKWIVEPVFSQIEHFVSGLAIVTRNDKKGVIDKDGRIIVPLVYDSMDRGEHGFLKGYRTAPTTQQDVFDPMGKLLFATNCGELWEQREGDWSIFLGCAGETWVTHKRGRPQKIAITDPKVTHSGDHLLLLQEGESDGAGDDRPERFFLLTPEKVVLSSADPAVDGKYDWIALISSGGEVARENPHLLPLAMLVKGYQQVAILTRDYTIVTQPEWKYESELLDYRYNSSDTALDGPFVVKTNQGWGAVDGQGKWVVEPIFRRLSLFRNGLAVGDGEKIVDNSGRFMELPPGHGYRRVAPFLIMGYDESQNPMLYHIRDGKPGKGDFPGGLTVGGRTADGQMSVKSGDKWGVVNTQGEWVLPASFENEPEPLSLNGRLVGWRIAVRVQGERYSEDRYGFVSSTGREVLAPRFVSVDVDMGNKVLRVNGGHRHGGLYTLDGMEILPTLHDVLEEHEEGWYLARRADEVGLLDERGEWVVPSGRYWFSQLEHCPYSREMTDDDVAFHLHVSGTLSTKDKPQSVPDDIPACWWSTVEGPYDDKQTVFYGFDWKERVRLIGETTEAFSNGWVVLKTGNKKRGFPSALGNTTGKVVGPLPYDNIESMRDGLFRVTKVTAKWDKRSQQYSEASRVGFIDSSGKVVVPLRFESADDFSEGRAVALAQGNLGVIDKAGRLLLHSAWRCGKYPVLLNGKGHVIWPKGEKPDC